MADGGYDVSDYCDIDPRFGTLADADALLADAHAARAAGDRRPGRQPHLRASTRGSPRRSPRARVPRSGSATSSATAGPAARSRPTTGSAPSAAGAWTRVREPDGRPGQWYLHTFAPEQPDLDWAQHGRPGGLRRRPAVLARPRASTGCGSTRRRPWRRCPACPTRGTRPGRGSSRAPGSTTRTGTSTPSTTSSGGGGPSGTPTTATGCSSPRPSSATPSGSAATCGRTRCTPASTSTT